MKKKCQWSKYIFFLVLGLLIIAPALSPLEAQEAIPEPEKHEVTVSLVMLPVFAVDTSGKPVHDLKKEEFKLFVNGESVDIAHFMDVTFQEETEVQEEVTTVSEPKAGKPEKVVPKQSHRYVFVIIDNVFNSHFGYRRAKKIARGIIENGSPNDRFILIENTAVGGLKHLAGPDKDKKKLLSVIKKLKIPTTKWNKNLYLTREMDADNNEYSMANALSRNMKGLMLQKKYSDRLLYKRQIKHFSDALRRFKYVLKTITGPKVVFLISEGIAQKSLLSDSAIEESVFGTREGHGVSKGEDKLPGSYDLNLLGYLKKTVESINHGGSVLYTVNPGRIPRDYTASGEMSLRMMATEGGGAYIAGAKTNHIITSVKTATSAYYEMAFVPTPDMGANLDIQLKCDRPGVKVLTFNKTQKSFPYRWMDVTQKKLFALNLVTGGSWSRVLGRIGRGKYKKLENTSTANGSTTLDVALPNQMRNKELDMFLISYDPVSKKTRVENFTRREQAKVRLEVKGRGGRKRFFVIVEPREMYCLYNEVI